MERVESLIMEILNEVLEIHKTCSNMKATHNSEDKIKAKIKPCSDKLLKLTNNIAEAINTQEATDE